MAKLAGEIGVSAIKQAARFGVRKGLNWVAGQFSTKSNKGLTVAQRRLYRRLSKLERGHDKELKTFDQPVAHNGLVGTTGAVVCLTAMAQGDTSITREGLQIQPRSIEVKLTVYQNASATGSLHRLIIFRDLEQHGTEPTVANLLESDGIASFPEHDTRPRFKILRDIVTTHVTGADNQDAFYKFYLKFGKKSRIWYSGPSAVDANLGKNQIYVYYVNTDDTNKISTVISSRLRFVDG